jgi:rhomboid protease GluP
MTDEPETPLRITPDMLLARRVDFERRMRRVPPVTIALIALLVSVFAVETAVGALGSTSAIVAAGALTRAQVRAGEYWRLVTAIFLHGGVDHLVSNAIALLILGMVCEHAFGRRQYFVLFVTSGVAGSLVSLLTGPGPSVGASGAIFGLQAAAIVLFRRWRDRLLVRDRRIGFVLAAWAAYSVLGGLATPLIDNGAHLGGAIAGALLGRRLHPVVLDPLPPERAAMVSRWTWVSGAALAYGALHWLVG